MKLWLLRPRDDLPGGSNPWDPWFDKCFGFVIAAPDEEQARSLAHANGCDENRGEFGGRRIASTTSPWLDAIYSTCNELTAGDDAEVIMSDVHSG